MDCSDCPICCSQFRDPRVVPCGHTFCQACLQELKPTHRQCPLCRVPFESVDRLPCNWVVNIMLEQNKERKDHKTPNIETCASCEENPREATFWCENCLAYFCGSCDATEHSGRVTRKHQRITTQEKMKKPIFSRCPRHHQDKKFYCKDDKEFLCDVCVVDDHKQHDVLSVFKYADGTREELKRCLSPLQNVDLWERRLNFLVDSRAEKEATLKDLRERTRDVETKLVEINEDLKKVEELRLKAQTSQVVFLKSIEELSISDLVDQSKLQQFQSKISEFVSLVIPQPSPQFEKALAHPDLVLATDSVAHGGITSSATKSALLSFPLSRGHYEWKATLSGSNPYWHAAGIAKKEACISSGFKQDFQHGICFSSKGQRYKLEGQVTNIQGNSTFTFTLDYNCGVFKIVGDGTQLQTAIRESDGPYYPLFMVYGAENSWRLDSFRQLG